MKKIGKLLAGMAIIGAVAFSGCKMANNTLGGNKDDKGKDSIIAEYTTTTDKTTKAEATAKINYKNETEDQIRDMRLFNTKKKGITVKIKMENLTSGSYNPGNMGIVFDLTKNKDKTYNFCLVGLANRSGKWTTYVAYYENIDESKFNESDFGTGDNTTDHTKACRTDVVDWTAINTKFPIVNKTLCAGIQIKPLQAKDTTKDNYDADNAYKVFFYEANDETVEALTDLARGDLADMQAAAVFEFNVPRNQIGADSTTKTVEEQMGFYARVNAGLTLTGEWQVADMEHEPAEIIWADETEGKAAVSTHIIK